MDMDSPLMETLYEVEAGEDVEESPSKSKKKYSRPPSVSLPKKPVPSFNPEIRRRDFRKYLDKSGIMDTLTRVLVQLYEEKEQPKDVVEFVYDRLNGGIPVREELSELAAQRNKLVEEVEKYQKENAGLLSRLNARGDGEYGGEDAEGLFEEEGEEEER